MGVGKQMQLTDAFATFANETSTFLLTLQLIGGPQPIDKHLLVVPTAFLYAFENLFSCHWTTQLNTRNIKR